MFCDVGPAVYRLHNVGGVATGYERRGCDGGEVEGGPGGGLGAFNYYSVAGEDGGYDGGDEVVELYTLASIPRLKKREVSLRGNCTMLAVDIWEGKGRLTSN